MTKAESTLKSLNLDYEVITPNRGWKIRPKDFKIDITIILIIVDKSEFEMFIWEDEQIKELHQFQMEENIGSIYSFLYEFKTKNCDGKSRKIRKD